MVKAGSGESGYIYPFLMSQLSRPNPLFMSSLEFRRKQRIPKQSTATTTMITAARMMMTNSQSGRGVRELDPLEELLPLSFDESVAEIGSKKNMKKVNFDTKYKISHCRNTPFGTLKSVLFPDDILL